MKHVEFILSSLGTILFCLSISLLLHATKQSNTLLLNIHKRNGDEVVTKGYQEKEEINTTYGQLIASLFTTVDYDIQIDELSISKAEHIGLDHDIYNIKKADYAKSYVYDARGNVAMIVYKSIP